MTTIENAAPDKDSTAQEPFKLIPLNEQHFEINLR